MVLEFVWGASGRGLREVHVDCYRARSHMATTLCHQRLAKVAPSCNVPVHVYRSMACIAAYYTIHYPP